MAESDFKGVPFDPLVMHSKVTTAASVSWDDIYKDQFKVQLLAIETKVQHPPAGPIGKADLLWELRETHLVRRVDGNVKKDLVVAQQCFIPTTRVQDFIHGMENSNGGFNCRYVKIRTKPEKDHLTFRATETTPKEVTRYHCQYGPQDHTGNVRKISAVLLPKRKPKISVALADKTRRQRQEKDGTAEGGGPNETGKKRRGRKKSEQSTTERNTEELPTTKKKPARRRKVQSVKPDGPGVPPLLALFCTSAQLNEQAKQSPRLDIDLNTPLGNIETQDNSVPFGKANILPDLPSTSRKPRQNKKLAASQRKDTRKRATKKLSETILAIDLNVVPHECNMEAATPVMMEAPDRAAAAETATPLGTNNSSRNTADVQNRTAAQSTGTGGNNTSTTARPKKSRDSVKKWGGSLKRGCLASFNVKTLYLLPHVTDISVFQGEHVNQDGVHCHGFEHVGDRCSLSWHLSTEIKEFVVKLLRDGHSVSQIMSKHIAVVKDSFLNGRDVTRDMFLHEHDVRNLATKVARETYMLHSYDAKSVQLWVQENPNSVFYYQETSEPVQGELTMTNMPFTIGIQTTWQRDMLLQFGHEGGVSFDATFGTNEKKFPLYTVMVFDEWHNGIPVAFILTSRSAQEDLTPWMRSLENTMIKERIDWKPNAFIVDCAQGEINSLRIVWPRTAIFLCLWHVHRAWQKQSCIKIQDTVLRAEILKGLAAIMYDRTGPPGDAATAWAIQKLQQLENTYPAANEFWDYVKGQWLPKVHMWVVGYRNLPYAGQDTNAAVESYHSYMKSVLKAERSRRTGRRVDWCIHILTGDILTHYWYQRLRKHFGFVDNRKEKAIVISALLRARDIPDTDVTLPEFHAGPAYVTSTTHRHIRYVVHNPTELWASCNCVHSQRGNTCKHKVKVLRLLHPQLAEGTVARYCGALKGTAAAGISHLLTPSKSGGVTSTFTEGSPSTGTPFQPSVEFDSTRKSVDLHSTLQMQAAELLEFVWGNTTLMEHLHTDFNRTSGKLKMLAADMESGLIHPSKTLPVFHIVDDGMGMRLGRLKDMLERKKKPPASRRLRMGAESPA